MGNAVTPVILGLLAIGPRSGYEIKATVDRSTRFFWAASYGQIYPELRRLEREGLIEGEDAPTGARSRRVYRLTKAGRKELESWLTSEGDLTVELRDESLLRLFFADALPRERRVAAARGPPSRARAVPRRASGDRRPPGEDPPFVDLVLRWGIDFNEWGVKWCTEQLQRLSATTAS